MCLLSQGYLEPHHCHSSLNENYLSKSSVHLILGEKPQFFFSLKLGNIYFE